MTYEFGERAVPVLHRVASELTRELITAAP